LSGKVFIIEQKYFISPSNVKVLIVGTNGKLLFLPFESANKAVKTNNLTMATGFLNPYF